MARLTTNHEKESAAIAWVMDLERARGREPRDTRHAGAPTDIESPPLLIEVKAVGKSGRGWDIFMETRQVEVALSNPNFYVYVVENVEQGDPGEFRLRVFGGERLARLLLRKKEQHYYTVPCPVAEYDAAPQSVPATEEPIESVSSV